MTAVVPARGRRGFAPILTFRSRSYRYLWAASVLWNQARWMDQVVLGWVVLEMTNSAWHVAVIGAVRWLPLMLFGLMGGAIADRFDRRWLLITAQGLGLGVCLATAILLATDRFDYAFALEAVSMNITRIIGPLVAGALIAYVSPAAAFWLMTLLYVAEIVLLRLMPLAQHTQHVASGPMLRYLSDGLKSLAANQVVVGVLLISACMNILVFPYQQLLPVFARDVLGVDAIGLGVLGAASGIGSLAGAAAIASSGRVPRSGLFFWVGSCLMSLAVAGFALSGSFPLALALIALSGLAQSAFASLQSTIVLSSASDHLRGRAMGALTLAIGSAPLGTLEIGAATLLVGAPIAVALNASACAALVGAIALRLPRFR